MISPNKINLMTTKEVMAQGWVAEARDKDGHLASTQGLHESMSANDMIKEVADFIASYETDRTVTIFTENLAKALEGAAS